MLKHRHVDHVTIHQAEALAVLALVVHRHLHVQRLHHRAHLLQVLLRPALLVGQAIIREEALQRLLRVVHHLHIQVVQALDLRLLVAQVIILEEALHRRLLQAVLRLRHLIQVVQVQVHQLHVVLVITQGHQHLHRVQL